MIETAILTSEDHLSEALPPNVVCYLVATGTDGEPWTELERAAWEALPKRNSKDILEFEHFEARGERCVGARVSRYTGEPEMAL